MLRISTHLQSVESSITCKKQELKLLTNGDTTTANENVKMVKRALKNLQQERYKFLLCRVLVEEVVFTNKNVLAL